MPRLLKDRQDHYKRVQSTGLLSSKPLFLSAVVLPQSHILMCPMCVCSRGFSLALIRSLNYAICRFLNFARFIVFIFFFFFFCGIRWHELSSYLERCLVCVITEQTELKSKYGL